MTDLHAQAKQILSSLRRPRRRAVPRVCPAFEHAEHRMIGQEGAKVSVWRLDPDHVQGPAVLLVHGWGDDTSLWTPLVNQLSGRGRSVVAFDLPGHGYSQGQTCDVDLAAGAIAAITAELGPVTAACAHSFGGPALVQALKNGVDIKTCALISPPVFQALQFERRARRDGASEELIQAMLDVGQAEGRFFDLVKEVRGMTAEALFVHSLDDDQCPAEEAQMAARAWPDARFWPVDGLGHRALVQDEDVVATLVAWLDP
jgi:pimeloyl-ACP methyl ester carboxylesterase